MPTPEERLADLGLSLPEVPPPVGNFVPVRAHGALLFLSGQGPLLESGLLARGKVGAEVDAEEAYGHSRRTALVLLAAARGFLGSLDPVARVVRILAMVNAQPDFTGLSRAADGCSDLLVDVFGAAGRHARTTVGVTALPGNITVEYEAILEIRSAASRRPDHVLRNETGRRLRE